MVKATIFQEVSYKEPFKWKDIKHIDLQDDDVIQMGHDEGFFSENNSMDPHFFVVITRMVEETDEQFARRQEQIALDNKWAKERRRESYLRLKKEFENESN